MTHKSDATPPASDAAVPAGQVREAAERLLQAVDERNMRGRDHVPSMRNEQVARSRMARALAAAPKVASDTGAGLDHLTRAKARADKRAASGEVSVEGSIYEGMEACLVQHGRTIAHVARYADAVDLAARLATPQVAGAGLREAGLAQHVRGIATVIRAFPNDKAWGGTDQAESAAKVLDRAVAALATPTDATDGATGGGEVQQGGKLGWDADGMCDDHYRFGCKECALPATTPGGDLLEQAARVRQMTEDEARDMLEYDADTVIATMRDWGYIRALYARNQTQGGEK